VVMNSLVGGGDTKIWVRAKCHNSITFRNYITNDTSKWAHC
jgi:hypothetical protein